MNRRDGFWYGGWPEPAPEQPAPGPLFLGVCGKCRAPMQPGWTGTLCPGCRDAPPSRVSPAPEPARPAPTLTQEAPAAPPTSPGPSAPYRPRYKGDSCREPLPCASVHELHPCPACGRQTGIDHRRACIGPLPGYVPPGVGRRGRFWPALGTRFPQCATCKRSITGRTHVCRPIKRSHRRPETDGLPASPTRTVPAELSPRKPFPAEGVTYDCRCISELNASHWTWQGRRTRSRDQRRRTFDALSPFEPPPGPWEVTVHKVGWASLDAHDSLRISVKSVVDQIADWLGVDDSDPRVTWLYSQEVTRKTEIVQTPRGRVSQSINRVRVAVRTREN